MNNKELNQEKIRNSFSQCYTKTKILNIVTISVFILSIILMSLKFHLTDGLSTVEFLSYNPKHETLIVLLELSSLVLFFGSLFGFLFIFICGETNKYYKVAEEDCFKFLEETEDEKLLEEKINEEIRWVRTNIATSPF